MLAHEKERMSWLGNAKGWSKHRNLLNPLHKTICLDITKQRWRNEMQIKTSELKHESEELSKLLTMLQLAPEWKMRSYPARVI